MLFENLTINKWKQFENLSLDFRSRLTVLTGANGSGKTTILNLLSSHFGWNFQEMSTPARDKESGIIRFFTRFFKSPFSTESRIGYIKYSNKTTANLEIPDSDSPNYQVSIVNMQVVPGFYIPSNRPVFSYQPVPHLSTKKRGKRDAFDLVSSDVKQMTFGGHAKPSNFHIKETLLTWAIYGYGNKVIESDDEQIQYYNGFQEILGKILPGSLGFREFTIRNSEVVLITDSGDFMIDAVSGGISALIDLAWHIYMFSTKDTHEFTVLIDEVENHLHASMQRKVLPDFLSAFPKVQFIVATHSPLIVGAVKDSDVYALRYNSSNRVYSESLDLVGKAKGAADVLREILGVPFTMPIWVEDSLQRIVTKYSKVPVSSEAMRKMREELLALGLADLAPEVIHRVVDNNDD